jgi:hypothetical protein
MKPFNTKNTLIFLVLEMFVTSQPPKLSGEDSTKFTLLETIFTISLKEKNSMVFMMDIPNLLFS